MSRPLCLFFTVLLLGFSFGVSAQYEVILLDTFDDDVVGQPPGTPEIGTSSYSLTGIHTIIDDYGSPRLRTIDLEPYDSGRTDWYPTGPPLMTEISYTLRIESYAGHYVAAQRFYVNVGGGLETIKVIWRDDGWVQLENTLVANWSALQDYDIRLMIDCVRDKAVFYYDTHSVIWFDLDFDCDSLDSFASLIGASGTSNGTYAIENVMIVDFLPIFIDGFETGDTSVWTDTDPLP